LRIQPYRKIVVHSSRPGICLVIELRVIRTRPRRGNRPLADLLTLLVPKAAGHNQYDVDQPPDSQSARRQKFENSCANLPGVEAMRAENAEKEAE